MHFTKFHTKFFPLFKVSSNINSTTFTWFLTNTEELFESSITINRRSSTGVFVYGIFSTINSEITVLFVTNPITWTVLTKPVINNIVFNKWFTTPTVNTYIWIINILNILFDKFEVSVHVTDFIMSLSTVERKTSTT